MRRDGFPGLFVAEIAQGPALGFVSLLAFALLGAAPLWAAAAFLALWYGAEAGFAHALGLTLGPRDLAAMVLRDVAQPAIWVATFARRGFEWRGNDMAAAPV